MDFKVKGHSDSSISIRSNNDKNVVFKESTNIRLRKSIKKHQDFSSNFFKTPIIHDVSPEPNNAYTMEYINGYSFFEFLNLCSKKDLDDFILKLSGYFNETIHETIKIPTNILINKLNSIGYYSDYYYIFGGTDYLEVYTGNCHGDMTLSNMIFKDDDVYLIDFLDSYIESPTMDLIKLRQDTHLHWSFNMIDVKKSDLMKSKIALKYIDEWITDTYDMRNYKILQIINLVRIFPYTSDIKIKNFIHEKIKLIWNE